MLNILKRSSVKLSLVAALAITPSIALGASSGGFLESSTEMTQAAIEPANYEAQIVRINTGINMVRINTDILENMAISVDSEWVEKVIAPLDYKAVSQLPAVKNDAYYSTVGFTNQLLGRTSISLTALGARLYQEANAIYKEMPNMNVFPDITNTKTFVTFKDVELIDVEAKTGNLYKNVEEATISLLPEDMKEEAIAAFTEYKEAREALIEAKTKTGEIEAWLDDDKNDGSSETAAYEEKLTVAEAAEEEAEKTVDTKEEIYFTSLKNGAKALESNYDASKLPLAKKLEKLLDTVDNNALGATGSFAAAVIGLRKGGGVYDQEVAAIDQAIMNNTNLNSPAYKALNERKSRMLMGSLMALPDIAIGTYYAAKQSSLAGEYQQIVSVIIEAGQAEEEAKEAENKAAQKDK